MRIGRDPRLGALAPGITGDFQRGLLGTGSPGGCLPAGGSRGPASHPGGGGVFVCFFPEEPREGERESI